MPSNFEIVSKAWKAAKFNINIVRIPENVINDKLAILSDGTGTLSFSRYERFLLNSCVVDPDRIYKFLESIDDDPDRLVDAAVEIKKLIIEVNPLLDPELLVITNENRIKIPEQSDKPGDVRRLVENPGWERPEFIGDTSEDDDAIDDIIKHMSPPIFPIGGRDNPGYGPDRIIPVEWKETELLVLIIQHDVTNIPEIFKERSTFTDEAQYKLFIVTRCIHDFQNLFILVDRMGATKKYGPEKITDMLYKMCIEHNKFLSWEEIDLDKVNRAVLRKYGKKRRDQNLFRKKPEDDSETDTDRKQKEQNAEDFYKEFEDLNEEDVLSLSDRIKKWVIGQSEAVDKVCETVQLAKCGLKEQNTPIGSFMFTGQSGVGKTWCARMFAQELCGDEHAMIRIDCSEYSQPHEVSKLIGCFTPEMSVTLSGGAVKSIRDIVVGDKVISHTGSSREVKRVFEYDYVGKLVNIKVAGDNRTIRCTPNHELLVVETKKCWHKNRGHVVCKPTCGRNNTEYPCTNRLYEKYSPVWKNAFSLKEGDLLLQARYKSNNKCPQTIDLKDYYPEACFDDVHVWCRDWKGQKRVNRFIPINEDFARFAGYYVSEGGSDKKRVDISFHYNETAYQSEVESLVHSLFGVTTKFVRGPAEEKSNHLRKRAYIGSKPIAALMGALFGHGGAQNKKVPDWWIYLPENLIRAFLTTALFGDGCLKISRRIDYSTVSINLVTQMRNMFHRLGYITYVNKNIPGKKKGQIRYRLYIGGTQIDKFAKEFSDINVVFGNIKNGTKGDVKKSNIQRMSYMDEKYLYRQIKSIKTKKYSGKVYDISVDKDVSYQVLDIIVHNSPQGYVGFEEGGYLTNALMKKPFSVVLFDEIEKAHPKLHNILLQIMDEGRLTSNKGETVSFGSALVVMTSNIGVKEVDSIGHRVGIGDTATITHDKRSRAIEEALKNSFKPEFLNRLDGIITFNELGKEEASKIIELAFRQLNEWLKEKGTNIVYTKKAADYIYSIGFKPEYGARPLKRAMRKEIMLPVSKLMLQNKALSNCTIKVGFDGDKLTFEIKNKTAPSKKEATKPEATKETGDDDVL